MTGIADAEILQEGGQDGWQSAIARCVQAAGLEGGSNFLEYALLAYLCPARIVVVAQVAVQATQLYQHSLTQQLQSDQRAYFIRRLHFRWRYLSIDEL
jgi:hypothetical protein